MSTPVGARAIMTAMLRNASIAAAVLVAAGVVMLVVLESGQRPEAARPTGAVEASDREGDAGASKVVSSEFDEPAHRRGRGEEPSFGVVRSTDAGQGLELSFVDAITGEPVADLPFHVFTERPRTRRLATGISDSAGRASVRELVQELVVLETARRPPYASSFTAIWLGAGGSREVNLAVGRGGRLTGRAVDELGAPAEGVHVRLDSSMTGRLPLPQTGDRAARVSVTDSEGEFSFAAVSSAPRGIWLVDGESRPETWLPVDVFWGNERRRAQVGEGGEARVDDLIVPRARTYAGVVVGPDGSPVPNALVSGQRRRLWISANEAMIGPGQDGFGLDEFETVTDGLGRFRLNLREWIAALLVWPVGGVQESFEVEQLEGGERREDLELRLSGGLVWVTEFVDQDGELVRLPLEEFDRAAPVLWSDPNLGARRARFRFRDANDAWVAVSAHVQGDGRFRVEPPIDPADVREVEVSLLGFVSKRVLATEWAGEDRTARIVVEPSPRLKLRAMRSSSARPLEYSKFSLHACSLPLDRRLAALEADESICCGLGSRATVFGLSPGDLVDVDLPLMADRASSVLLFEGFFSEHVQVIGPFEPGPDRHRVLLDEELFGSDRSAPDVVGVSAASTPPPVVEPEDVPVENPVRRANPSSRRASDHPPRPDTLVVRVVDGADEPVNLERGVMAFFDRGEDYPGRAFLQRRDEGLYATTDEVRDELLLHFRTSSPSPSTYFVQVREWSPGQPETIELEPATELRATVRTSPDRRFAELRLFVNSKVAPWAEIVAAHGLEFPPSADGTRTYQWRLGPGTYRVTAKSSLFVVEPGDVTIGNSGGLKTIELNLTEVR